jgi:hypothetical protein
MNLSRRGFFGMLAGLAASPLVAKIDKILPPAPAPVASYADYLTTADLALDVSIDPILERLAAEMNYRLALSLDCLVRATAPNYLPEAA